MPQYELEVKTLQNLLWEFGLTESITAIQTAPISDDTSPTLICIVKNGSSAKVIATVFNEYDYFPKYAVIRERFLADHPNIEVKFLI